MNGIEHFAAALGADRSARDRARQRWLERQSAESSSMAGILLDLAELEESAMFSLRSGRRFGARVGAVGDEITMLEDSDSNRLLLRHSTLASVRPQAGRQITGDRLVSRPFGFDDALSLVAEDRPDASLLDRSGQAVLFARLMSVGVDVLTVRPNGRARDEMHVATDAIGGIVTT